MARMMDATKRKLWGDRFRRFDGCDLTVADFCLAENRRRGVQGLFAPSCISWSSCQVFQFVDTG
jgi:hypothetical protein